MSWRPRRSEGSRLWARAWREPEDAGPSIGAEAVGAAGAPRHRGQRAASGHSRGAAWGKLGLAIFTRTLFQPQRPFVEVRGVYLVEVSLR